MALDLVRVHKQTEECVVALVSPTALFKDAWLPLVAELGFKWVPRLGEAGWLNEEARLGLVAELTRMRGYIREQNNDERMWIAGRIDNLLPVLAGHTCDEYEFVTG